MLILTLRLLLLVQYFFSLATATANTYPGLPRHYYVGEGTIFDHALGKSVVNDSLAIAIPALRANKHLKDGTSNHESFLSLRAAQLFGRQTGTCPVGEFECADGSGCCDNGGSCCTDGCCNKVGSKCCGDGCCPLGAVCYTSQNNTCCDIGEKPCGNGLCIPSTSTCCGDGSSCLVGNYCTTIDNQPYCCPDGKTCTNSGGSCTKTCPGSTVCCDDTRYRCTMDSEGNGFCSSNVCASGSKYAICPDYPFCCVVGDTCYYDSSNNPQCRSGSGSGVITSISSATRTIGTETFLSTSFSTSTSTSSYSATSLSTLISSTLITLSTSTENQETSSTEAITSVSTTSRSSFVLTSESSSPETSAPINYTPKSIVSPSAPSSSSPTSSSTSSTSTSISGAGAESATGTASGAGSSSSSTAVAPNVSAAMNTLPYLRLLLLSVFAGIMLA